MHITRHERAERLREQAMQDTAPSAPRMLEIAGGDASSVQSAWCSFVPLLAHPVMAAPADRAMKALDAAASALSRTRPEAA